MIAGAGPYPKDVSKCRSCDADMVFMKTRKGKWMPVNVMPKGKFTDKSGVSSPYRGPTAGETDFVYGELQPHFLTCTDPDRYRGGPSS